ncbi:hypothetical protein PHISCL_02970 [Aspergillus sclerotialis]|uniref:SGNH hydrolase-type esterase domain-containing protein n=1 Tax=Aspergillus sclerotialis TaxID=2070753 RepID=A0A3A3A3U6_9EURO|nr:hypothetical protein PHISCL_02970 [Aspergillus sclerotialis]
MDKYIDTLLAFVYSSFHTIQLANVSVAADSNLVKSKEFNRKVEIIGDSLAAGQFTTYEGLSSFAYDFAAGLGNVEYSVTAYPGICLDDKKCYDNARGMLYQWRQVSDCSPRAVAMYGTTPERWDPTMHRPADLVVINIGTNDWRSPNDLPKDDYYKSYIKLIDEIHSVWPDAQIIIMSLWGYFDAAGTTYKQIPAYVGATKRVAEHYVDQGFVHYFDTTGILQHNDIGPGVPHLHPTDVGHIKVASHLMQYVKMKFGWGFAATGPEVQHDTTYWNNENGY